MSINVYYLERRVFSLEHPEGIMENAVVIDDDIYTVPQEDIQSGKIIVYALPLSSLIDEKRQFNRYDPDFEETLACILFKEEEMEKQRLEEFKEKQTKMSSASQRPPPASTARPQEVIPKTGLHWARDFEAEAISAFNGIIDHVASRKRLMEFLVGNRAIENQFTWKSTVSSLKAEIRSELAKLRGIRLNPTCQDARIKLIQHKKTAIARLLGVSLDSKGDFRPPSGPGSMVGRATFVPTDFELELEEYLGILDFICRRFKDYYAGIQNSSSTVESMDFIMDELQPQRTTCCNVLHEIDELDAAMRPLQLNDDNSIDQTDGGVMTPETGAVPKRRHH